MAAARYFDRHTVTRKKAGHLDAMVLANILRTDKAAHCALPDDSELAQAIAIPARAPGRRLGPHSSRQQTPLQLREYFPGFLAAFQRNREGISSSVARTVLAAAPTPEQAAKLTRTKLRSLLKKASCQRGIETEAERLRDALRTPHMHPSPQVEQAMGLRQSDRLTGSPGPLRQATSRRRWPYRRPAQPLQPHARTPPPLPHQGHCL